MTVRNYGGGGVYNLSYDADLPALPLRQAGNRMTGVSGATTATFVYDGDGNRVKGTVAGVTTIYIGNYFEWKGSASTMVKYYYAGSIRIAMRTGDGSGTTGLLWLFERLNVGTLAPCLTLLARLEFERDWVGRLNVRSFERLHVEGWPQVRR